jgi:excisionase family DNA binding protein
MADSNNESKEIKGEETMEKNTTGESQQGLSALEMLTVKTVARMLALSPTQIRRLCADGSIPCIRIGRRRPKILIPKVGLEEVLKNWVYKPQIRIKSQRGWGR